jgi:hypothetical protein
MNRPWNRGEVLLETAILLPSLLLLLAGSYVCSRAVILRGAAESAAHAEAIRAGRGLVGIEKKMASSLLPRGEGVEIRAGNGSGARLLPAPFPALSGRAKGTVEIRKDWKEAGSIADFPGLRISRTAEMTADDWSKDSKSGKNIRRTVKMIVAAGILR